MITVAATIVSMYALDAVATAAGVALVASGWLAGMPPPALAAFLLASYACWAIGLRSNLRANWTLLEQTGTSTNAISKLAFDLTGSAIASAGHPRLRRWATGAGYVGTELVKEVPYYAGAFAAVLVNDDLTHADIVLFLGGANLGAAVYEAGLARLTHLALRRRSVVNGRSTLRVVPSATLSRPH